MNTIHFIGYSAVHPSTFLFEMVTAPGQAICYRACRDTYQNDWIRFTSDDPLVTQFPLQGVPFPVSDTEYCHHLIKLLTWETSFATPDSDLITSDLLQVLFLRLRQDTSLRQASPRASALLHLRKKIYNSPQHPWTIQTMAEELHLSTGYTQILYKQMFGVSCMDDVIGSRIRMAREQLSYTEKPVAELADDCGYRNVEHFCRQFRQLTGLTPGAFRRSSAEAASGCSEKRRPRKSFPKPSPIRNMPSPPPLSVCRTITWRGRICRLLPLSPGQILNTPVYFHRIIKLYSPLRIA